jgi:hypothetical protein
MLVVVVVISVVVVVVVGYVHSTVGTEVVVVIEVLVTEGLTRVILSGKVPFDAARALCLAAI